MYHRIDGDEFDPWGEVVTPENFREQLEWLVANRTLLRLTDFVDQHRNRTLPRNAIAITFDDGYACLVETAAPLLEGNRVPATVFISPKIVRSGMFWWQELRSIVLGHEATDLDLDGRQIELGERSSGDQLWRPGSPPSTPRQRAYAELQMLLSRMPPDDLNRNLDVLRRIGAPAPDARKRPMSAEEISRTTSDRIEFGSHALSHAWLPNLNDDQQTQEIEDSVEQCRQLTGRKPEAFAYPYGMFDDRAKGKVAAAGFSCACTTQDLAVSRRSPTYALPRLAVGNWGAPALQKALSRLCLA